MHRYLAGTCKRTARLYIALPDMKIKRNKSNSKRKLVWAKYPYTIMHIVWSYLLIKILQQSNEILQKVTESAWLINTNLEHVDTPVSLGLFTDILIISNAMLQIRFSFVLIRSRVNFKLGKPHKWFYCIYKVTSDHQGQGSWLLGIFLVVLALVVLLSLRSSSKYMAICLNIQFNFSKCKKTMFYLC